jgi:CheY-like chemotaxis protein
MAKVLVVDDEKGIRGSVRTILAYEKPAVSLAENGREALTVAEKESPDLILLDIKMPEMDGMEALDEIGDMPRSNLYKKLEKYGLGRTTKEE